MDSKQKKVLIVTPYFPPFGGGLERYAYEIAKRLKDNHGWRVVIVTSGSRFGKDVQENSGGLIVYRLSYHFKFSNTPFSLGWIWKVHTILKNENPDVINIHTPVPGLGNIFSIFSGKIPIVITYHTGSMRKKKIFPDLFVWLYEHGPLQLFLRRANKIVCASDFVRFDFLKKYIYKSSTITPAVDSDTFKPDEIKKSLRPRVIFVAGLNRSEQYKGLQVLIDAVKKVSETVPTIELVVVGDGDMQNEYERRAKNLGLNENVIFTGRLGREKIVEEYQKAHVFALPSANENFSLAVLEAMSTALPVIASNVGGLPALVSDNKNGFLIAPEDSVALADKISKLIANPNIRNTFGAKGRSKVLECFSWDRRSSQYDEVFKSVSSFNFEKLPLITVVSSYFYPKIGGLENYAYNIAKKLNQSGNYRVNVITSNYESRGYKQDIIDGMTVHRLPTWGKVSNTPVNFLWYWWIRRIFKSDEPSIINVHSPVPFMADIAVLASNNKPVVLTYHSGSMLKNKWPIDIIIWLYEHTFLKLLFQKATYIVAYSPIFIERSLKKFADKTNFIAPGVDLEQFKATQLSTTNKIVTFVGRIEKNSSWKGIQQLLEALVLVVAKYPEARLELVGEGDAVEYYSLQAKKLGISNNVVFCGPQIGEGLVDAYKRSSVLVLPSLTDSESFGIVLIEAMASGRPVIGSKIGGIPYVIDDEKNGLLVPPNKPDVLAEAITRILVDRALAKKFAEAGRMKVEKQYSWDTQVNKYKELFAKMLYKEK